MAQENSTAIRSFAFRLGPHQDVKQSILAFAQKNKIKAGCIVSAVGSIETYNLRFANQESGTQHRGHFEVVSLTGTFSDTSSHLHMSISDSKYGEYQKCSQIKFHLRKSVTNDLRESRKF